MYDRQEGNIQMLLCGKVLPVYEPFIFHFKVYFLSPLSCQTCDIIRQVPESIMTVSSLNQFSLFNQSH